MSSNVAKIIRDSTMAMREDVASVNRFLSEIRTQDEEITRANRDFDFNSRNLPPIRGRARTPESATTAKKPLAVSPSPPTDSKSIFSSSDTVPVPVTVVEPTASPSSSSSSPTAASTLSFERYKELGTSSFRSGKFQAALRYYTHCLRLDPSNATILSNRAAVQSKLKNWNQVEKDCSSCLKADPGYVKAWWRRGAGRRERGDFRGALSDFRRGLCLCEQGKMQPIFQKQITAVEELIAKKVREEEQQGQKKRRKRFVVQEVDDDEEVEGISEVSQDEEQGKKTESVADAEVLTETREDQGQPQQQPESSVPDPTTVAETTAADDAEPEPEPDDQPEETEVIEEMITPDARSIVEENEKRRESERIAKKIEKDQARYRNSAFFSPLPRAAARARARQRLARKASSPTTSPPPVAQKVFPTTETEPPPSRIPAKKPPAVEENHQEEPQPAAKPLIAEIESHSVTGKASESQRVSSAPVGVSSTPRRSQGRKSRSLPESAPRSFSAFEVYLRQFEGDTEKCRLLCDLVMRENRKKRGYFVRLIGRNLSGSLVELFLDAAVNLHLASGEAIGVQLAYDLVRFLQKIPRFEIMVQFAGDRTEELIRQAFATLEKKIGSEVALARLASHKAVYLKLFS